ncbi:unnamed protein product [Allacma fusca]|uniref:Uncharacterized protein n=1 Tax=Allacma fusca TaxID=39272 RepID=A0A8J2K0C7_9HEXA|nr:unnamed protein product [Allacma fusca]
MNEYSDDDMGEMPQHVVADRVSTWVPNDMAKPWVPNNRVRTWVQDQGRSHPIEADIGAPARRKLRHGYWNEPVASKTLLGWAVHGNLPKGAMDVAIQRTRQGEMDVAIERTRQDEMDVASQRTQKGEINVVTLQTPKVDVDVAIQRTRVGEMDVLIERTPKGEMDVAIQRTPKVDVDITNERTREGDIDVAIKLTWGETNAGNEQTRGEMDIDEQAQGEMDVVDEHARGEMDVVNEQTRGEMAVVGEQDRGEMCVVNEQTRGEMADVNKQARGEMDVVDEQARGEMDVPIERILEEETLVDWSRNSFSTEVFGVTATGGSCRAKEDQDRFHRLEITIRRVGEQCETDAKILLGDIEEHSMKNSANLVQELYREALERMGQGLTFLINPTYQMVEVPPTYQRSGRHDNECNVQTTSYNTAGGGREEK